jgi:hypothetical protein
MRREEKVVNRWEGRYYGGSGCLGRSLGPALGSLSRRKEGRMISQ